LNKQNQKGDQIKVNICSKLNQQVTKYNKLRDYVPNTLFPTILTESNTFDRGNVDPKIQTEKKCDLKSNMTLGKPTYLLVLVDSIMLMLYQHFNITFYQPWCEFHDGM